MKSKKWIDDEISFLMDNYPKYGSSYCAEKLGRTIKAVNRRCFKLQIKYNWVRPNWHKDTFEQHVAVSRSFTNVAINMSLKPSGSNINVIKKYIALYKISTKHFLTRKELGELGLLRNKRYRPLSEILVQNSTFSSTHLKNRLYKEGIKKKSCEKCSQGEIWKNKKMSLILDHINGNHFDNRLENLRILCPNCNATLETHCKKNIGKYKNINNSNWTEPSERWSQEEYLFLKENYKIKGPSYCAKILNRTENCIRSMASRKNI